MESSRTKKAVAASLSLALALGSVPAVALADDEGQSDNSSEESARASYTFSANGGQFGSSDVANIEANEDGSVDAPTPTRSGYTFKGWYSTSNLDQIPESYQQYYKLDPSAPNGFTWFAAWEKSAESETPAESKAFEAQFVANGGAFADGSETLAAKADADGIVSQPATPTRDGYTFKGWYWVSSEKGMTSDQLETQKVNFSNPLKGNANFFALWEKNAEQTELNVLYVANGGTFVDGNDTMQGVADSDGIMRRPAAPTREGYTFDGWYWHADLSQLTEEQKQNEKVDFSQPVQSNVTIYAQWTKNEEQAEEITVKFVDNFNNTVTNTVIKKGETVDKPAIDPSYDGWEFEGWSSTLKDEQGNWDYTPVDFSKAVEDTDGDGVVTYYAFYNEAKADDNGNGNAATDKAATDESDAQGSDQQAADESSEAPQTGDATNAAAVAGIGGIAGLMAAAAALLRRRRNN